jgi:large conductance mechanosensitive channel
MIQEFKDFAMKGNVIDLAVWVVIWSAFSKIVSSLVEFIITPLVGIFMMGSNFAGLSFGIGDAQIKYGMFIQAILDFTIVAFVLFMIVKGINTTKVKISKQDKLEKQMSSLTKDQEFLQEIRDILKKAK